MDRRTRTPTNPLLKFTSSIMGCSTLDSITIVASSAEYSTGRRRQEALRGPVRHTPLAHTNASLFCIPALLSHCSRERHRSKRTDLANRWRREGGRGLAIPTGFNEPALILRQAPAASPHLRAARGRTPTALDTRRVATIEMKAQLQITKAQSRKPEKMRQNMGDNKNSGR